MPDKSFETKVIKETSKHTGGTSWVHPHDGGVTITTNVRDVPYKDHSTFDNNGNPK